ncbi:MAG: hypothetical protein DMD43_06325 [Gemmatimonadetes bacterium]|nr:MAG: hypothetical protein DMD43_06325 [Gemmatimonadota bacterium]
MIAPPPVGRWPYLRSGGGYQVNDSPHYFRLTPGVTLEDVHRVLERFHRSTVGPRSGYGIQLFSWLDQALSTTGRD